MALDDIKSYMIGIILFIVVITGGIYIFGSFITVDSSIDATNELSTFNNTLNKADEITTSVNAMNTQLKSVSDTDTGLLGWLNAILGSAYKGLQSVGDSLTFVAVAGEDTAMMFGLPPSVIAIISLITLITIIIVVVAIWSAITKT